MPTQLTYHYFYTFSEVHNILDGHTQPIRGSSHTKWVRTDLLICICQMAYSLHFIIIISLGFYSHYDYRIFIIIIILQSPAWALRGMWHMQP